MLEEKTENPSGQCRANQIIASNLLEMADLLEQQDADGFRVTAYRHAADTIMTLEHSLDGILVKQGVKGLIALPAIGVSIASAIAEMLHTGRWGQLERLRGTTAPEKLFCTVPGIGPKLAAKLHDELHIDTLEALEVAAHDGRLRDVPGFGPRRLSMIKASLLERLGRRRIAALPQTSAPSAAQLLDVDDEYRRRAAKGNLRKIAPKRFNPDGLAWLPILHTQRQGWRFSVLFSNTQRAHELNRIQDWVVIFYETDGAVEGQCTVVTETSAPWRGYRMVRGQERECAEYYRSQETAA